MRRVNAVLIPLFVAVLFSAKAFGHPGDYWVKAADSNDGSMTHWLDTSSIQRMGKNAFNAWVKVDYAEPKRDGLFTKSYVSESRLLLIRCDENVMATTQRIRFDNEQSIVKQDKWPEAKWEFHSTGPTGSVARTEADVICSLGALPSPKVDFSERGDWVRIGKATDYLVDRSRTIKLSEKLFVSRIRMDFNEDKPIAGTRYRQSFMYIIGDCEREKTGLYAVGFVSGNGKPVESSAYPFTTMKMDGVEPGSVFGDVWSVMCQPQKQESPESSSAPVGGSTGTGFLVSRDGHIVTNSHVVNGCKRIDVMFPDRQKQEARILGEDPVNDLAVLKTNREAKQFAVFRKTAPELGEQVYAFGFPLSGTLSSGGIFTDGVVNATTGIADDTSQIQISAPVQPGNSGGPLFDRYGQVIGVVASKLNVLAVAKKTGDIAQNVNFAIKSAMAQNFLDAHSINYTGSSSALALDPTSISTVAKAVTVFVECQR